MTEPSPAASGGQTPARVRRLLDVAERVYAEQPAALERLQALRQRLDRPLRIAVVGRVKAGKSTLLNALLGESLAATDAGECTQVVTWYRHGSSPRVLLERVDGTQQVLPAHRVEGALQFRLGDDVERVDRIVVDWPTPALAWATLIDTPGTASLSAAASARTENFLGDDLAGADALVFLTRRMSPEDLALLARFQAATSEAGAHTTTLTVLSRPDESGSGGLDALLSAHQIAERITADPAVRAVTEHVLPVSGLLGLAGRTLRHREFVALRTLALADRADAEDMLLSADRFVRPQARVPVSPEIRNGLLHRLGLFGIRLSIGLLRTGVADVDTLADQLVRRSGLAELERLIAVHFQRRGSLLRAATVLRAVERLLRSTPAANDSAAWQQWESVRLAASDLAELEVLTRLRATDTGLPEGARQEAERLLGADGLELAERLDRPAGTPVSTLREHLLGVLERWRGYASDPLAQRSAVDLAEGVVRTCEVLLTVAVPESDQGQVPIVAEANDGDVRESGSTADSPQPGT